MAEPLGVMGKLLALERVFSNQIDNAVLYGERA